MSNGEAGSGTARRPRWRRIRAVLVGLAVTLVLGISAIRTVRMWGLPYAPEPFDVEAFQAEVVAESENAYPFYVQAQALMGAQPATFWPKEIRVEPDWPDLPPESKTWLEQNLPALEVWRKGTERPLLQEPLPDRLLDGPRTTPSVMFMSSLAKLQASRLQSEGKPGLAWRWHKARLRFLLQNGRRRGILSHWASSFGFNQFLSQAQTWADHPAITVEQLRHAIADLEAIAPLYPKRSDSLKAEYVAYAEMIDDQVGLLTLQQPPALGGVAVTLIPPETFAPAILRAELFLEAEPERSRRVLRLAFANWIAQADKAPAQRAKVHSTEPLVFEPELGETPPISPASLAAQMTSAPLMKFYRSMNPAQRGYLPGPDEWPTLLDADRRAVANLIITYASRIHEIETGKWPDSPEALIGKVLPRLPNDYVVPNGGDMPIER